MFVSPPPQIHTLKSSFPRWYQKVGPLRSDLGHWGGDLQIRTSALTRKGRTELPSPFHLVRTQQVVIRVQPRRGSSPWRLPDLRTVRNKFLNCSLNRQRHTNTYHSAQISAWFNPCLSPYHHFILHILCCRPSKLCSGPWIHHSPGIFLTPSYCPYS